MWARKYDRCIVCGTIEKRHKGEGFCVNCWTREYRKRNIEKIRKRDRDRYEKNPEKFKKIDKKSREKNCERIKERGKKYYKKNKERIREYRKEYYKKNLERIKEKDKRYYQENIEEKKEYSRKYREANPEKNKKDSKKWREKNPEKVKEYCGKWRKAHPEEYKRKVKIYIKNKKCIDVHFKLRCNISTFIGHRLRSRLLSKKGKSIIDFLPYTIDELIEHLEGLFTEGMTWESYGQFGWHIDHVKPDSLFNYKNVDDKEFQKCWALSNLQPLWWLENIKKSNKY